MNKYCTTSVVMGYIVAQIRTEAGLKKQSDLGGLVNMSTSAISKIERGESGTSLDFLLILASLVGTKASAIVEIFEKTIEALRAQNTVFIEETDFILIVEPEALQTINDIEKLIPFELTKEIKSLVIKQPQSVDEQMTNLGSDLDDPTVNPSGIPELKEWEEKLKTGEIAWLSGGNLAVSGMGAFIILSPLTTVVVGSTLLASRFLKKKKAP